MDDCVAAVTAAAAQYIDAASRESKMSISWHSLHVEDAIVAREHICSLCNVHRTAVMFSVQIICC